MCGLYIFGPGDFIINKGGYMRFFIGLRNGLIISLILWAMIILALFGYKDNFIRKETGWIEWKPSGNFNVTEFLERENQKLEETRIQTLEKAQ